MAKVSESDVIAGVSVVEPDLHGDDRGYMLETYRSEWLPHAREMVQGNRANRQRGCLVGLHFHFRQADYWYVASGRARIVLHDLRDGSPTDGATLRWTSTATPPTRAGTEGIYIPSGVAHGFGAITDVTMQYLVDRYYDPGDELGVAWDDPEIAADWKLSEPIVSRRSDQPAPQGARAATPVWAGPTATRRCRERPRHRRCGLHRLELHPVLGRAAPVGHRRGARPAHVMRATARASPTSRVHHLRRGRHRRHRAGGAAPARAPSRRDRELRGGVAQQPRHPGSRTLRRDERARHPAPARRGPQRRRRAVPPHLDVRGVRRSPARLDRGVHRGLAVPAAHAVQRVQGGSRPRRARVPRDVRSSR